MIFKLKKKESCNHKSPIFLKDVDIEKVFLSKKISSDEKNYKYFIGYLYNDHKVKPLHIILSKTNAYVKSYDEQLKWMYFLIEDNELLVKYSTIWDKASTDIKKEFDSEPVYNKRFWKTKLKFDGDEVTDFHDKEILRWTLITLV